MTDINQLVATALHTAAADARLAEADAAFLTVFLSLKGEEQARRWRGLDEGAKFRLVVRRIEQLGMSWMPSVVEAQIAKYDAKYAAGPVDAAVEGALERLAIEHSDAARLADRLGDMAHRKVERAAATAFTNALRQYRAGVRPELLQSGAWLVPSSTPGKPAHIVRMDGDWICACAAGANMHWPIAMAIGIEVSQDDMERFDDGDDGPIIRLNLYDDGDLDFSQDEPSVGVQLKALGVRRALGWEDAQLVTVTEFRRPFHIRVMPIDAPSWGSAALLAAQRYAPPDEPDIPDEYPDPTPGGPPPPERRALAQRLTQARRPLFAAFDAETARLAAKGEMRAELEALRARRNRQEAA